MADWKGVPLRLKLSSADLFREAAIFCGSSQVKTPSSKSRAIERLVTFADQFFTTSYIIIFIYGDNCPARVLTAQ